MTGKNKKKQGFIRLLELAGARKYKLFASGFLAIISSVLSLAPFFLIYLILVKLLDPSFGPQDYGYVWKLAWLTVLAVLARLALGYSSNLLAHLAAFDIIYGLRTNLAKHLGSLPMGYFTGTTSGEIKTTVSEDVENIELFVAHHIRDVVEGISLPIITIAYLFFVDWRMALVALISLPIGLLLIRAMMNVVEDAVRKWLDSLEKMNTTIVEYVRGMPVIKVFNQTATSFSRFKDSVNAFRDFTLLCAKKQTPYWAAFTVLVGAPLFFLLPFGTWFYLNGSLSLPKLLLCLMLGSGYMILLLKFAEVGGLLSRISEGVRRMDRIFSEPEIPAPDTPKIPESYDIEFRNVSFSYGEEEVLHEASFKAKEGTVTALVGPSGAGKTTIAQLLPRMWDIDKGEILIGGVNIKNIPLEELMNTIGFAFQDVYMFSDTVYENIRMGMKNVREEDIIQAAKIAHCHEFIEKLPNGYDTIIGEGGKVHLSSGERQRIALARMVLKNPPIVIVDEAIASVDPENEAKILDAFAEIIKGKTVIVIAHRLSTITDADQILVVDNGRIVERGTHDGLLKSGGLYKKMWDMQTSAQKWAFNIEGGTKND